MGNINQNIVIVNEFTIHGSRGTTPGNYVSEYMGRDSAVENLTPTMARSSHIQKLEQKMNQAYKRSTELGKSGNVSDFVTRYMARSTATEAALLDGHEDRNTLSDEFEKIQGMSGIAFGPRSLSLSHDDVKEVSKTIQEEHDKGKPVLKTVISFDTEYLKEMGVLPKDFEPKKRGDLYGKADQAKLRLAIQHGMKAIAHEFSDPEWIGVIQVDTMHYHCHLAIVDKGTGKRFTKKGEQKGTLTSDMMMALRRGIDNSLSHCKTMKPLSIQMESERRNTVSFIKRFTYKIMEERGLPQYLLACLPKEDKSLWKASINTDGGDENIMTITKGGKTKQVHGNMRKANEIVRSYVIDILNRPDSGFQDAMRIKHDYLEARKNRGDFDNYQTYKTRGTGKNRKSVLVRLSPEEAVREEEKKFRDEVIMKGMNAVYDVLKGIDDKAISLHTPLLDAMSMPYEEMANYVKEDKLIEFGFRLRSYNSRLEYHKESYRKTNTMIHQYEDGRREEYDPASSVVYDFLKIQQEYDHALMCKYQYFLHFYHIKDEYAEEYEDLMMLRGICGARRAMKTDKRFYKQNLDPDKAEREGREIYGIAGASSLLLNPEAFDDLQRSEDEEYAKALRNFKEQLAEYGLLYDEDKNEVSKGLAYEFDDVKAYDLHHMSYDFTYDFQIATKNATAFIEMAEKRYAAYIKAQEYMRATGQEDILREIVNPEDIQTAKDLADELKRNGAEYKTRFEGSEMVRRNTATIRLDDEVYSELSDRKMMKSLQEIMEDIAISDATDIIVPSVSNDSESEIILNIADDTSSSEGEQPGDHEFDLSEFGLNS